MKRTIAAVALVLAILAVGYWGMAGWWQEKRELSALQSEYESARELQQALLEEKTALAADGLGYVDWNCYTGDGLPGVLTTEKAYQNAVSSVGEQKIVVMLMHDYSAATLEALPDIIDTLKAKGYMMMPLFRESVMIRSA